MKYSFGLLLLLFLCCLGCTEEIRIDAPSARHTLLVYMAGDNNLSGETYTKIDSITRGWRNKRDNLLVYRDSDGAGGTPVLLRVVGDETAPYTEVVKEYPESNSANAEVFAEVLRDALSLYPAPGYGLLVFSHGTGWLPGGLFDKPRSTTLRSITNDKGREMELSAFASAIPDGTFNYIVMEACLMSSVAVAYELRNKADYLLASSAEILSPGFSPLYAELIGYLFEPAANLEAFARRYYAYCNTLSGSYRSATISLLDLGGMDALALASRPFFADTISGTVPAALPSPATVQCFDWSGAKLFFDLGDYMSQLAPDLYPAFEESLRRVVVYQAASPSFVGLTIRRHSGLTTYIEQSAYPALNTAWHNTAWYKATH